MSIGFCLWETGAAKWLAVNWLVLFQSSPPIVFILGMAFFVMMMTNFIMNVAAIAISMPVALVMAPYVGVAPDVVLFASLVTAGMPFLLLVGAAPNAIAYTASKWAVRGMSKSAALELADLNIRVNSVHPGPIDTDMLKIRSREDMMKRVQQLPFKRMGTVDDIAGLVMFLLSDASRYMTGAELAIDGGAAM